MDHLSSLPDELKLSIFKHIDSFNIITLEEVSKKFAQVSCDKELSSILSFYIDYRFKSNHLQGNLLCKLRREVVTSLNINCVYWIPKYQIKQCLKLNMLNSLYALDTNLEFKDICCSGLLHLKVLAITDYSESCNCFNSVILKNLKKICIQYAKHYHLDIYTLLDRCKNLEELWLLDLSEMNLRSITSEFTLPNSLRRVVMKSMAPFLDFWDDDSWNRFGLNTAVLQCKRGTANLYLENRDKGGRNIYDSEFYEENPAWKSYIYEFMCDYPFGLQDAKKLVYQHETLNSIHFQELSLTHMSVQGSDLPLCVLSILLQPNTQFLRKLSISMCIFDSSVLFSHNPPSNSNQNLDDTRLGLIVKYSPLIEELEILDCRCTFVKNPAGLSCIARLSKLTSLFLQCLSVIHHAKYLLEICKSCTMLTSLKILSSTNSNLNNHLCMSIPYLKMLKDLRYHQPYLPLDRIIENLASNGAQKLERVVLTCNKIETFSAEPLKRFLILNPQLKLLYISVQDLSDVAIRSISKDLKLIKSDQQIFIVTNSKSRNFIPQIHLIEMFQWNTAVGVIHPFNEFH